MLRPCARPFLSAPGGCRVRRMCLAGSVAILGLGLILPFAGHCGSLREDVTRQSQENFAEFLQLLAIPNVGSEPADIQRNAAFLEELFRKRGFTTRQLENPAHRPAVFAELTPSSRNAKAVLFYIHFDGQPVIPVEWHQP